MGTSDVEDGLLGEPDVINIRQTEESSYGTLWNITETWYDGAKVYFYAEQPEDILADSKLEVIHKDHMTVRLIPDTGTELGWGSFTVSFNSKT